MIMIDRMVYGGLSATYSFDNALFWFI